VIDVINKVLKTKAEEMPEPIEIKPGLNIFKMKNPLNNEEFIEISINIKI
jgi:hypothetical protein